MTTTANIPLVPLAIGITTASVNFVADLIGRPLFQGRRVHELVVFSFYHQCIANICRKALADYAAAKPAFFIGNAAAGAAVYLISRTAFIRLDWKSGLALAVANTALAYFLATVPSKPQEQPHKLIRGLSGFLES